MCVVEFAKIEIWTQLFSSFGLNVLKIIDKDFTNLMPRNLTATTKLIKGFFEASLKITSYTKSTFIYGVLLLLYLDSKQALMSTF